MRFVCPYICLRHNGTDFQLLILLIFTDVEGICAPPPDGISEDVVSNFQLISVIVLYSMGVVGIIITTICLLFNFIFRNRK